MLWTAPALRPRLAENSNSNPTNAKIQLGHYHHLHPPFRILYLPSLFIDDIIKSSKTQNKGKGGGPKKGAAGTRQQPKRGAKNAGNKATAKANQGAAKRNQAGQKPKNQGAQKQGPKQTQKVKKLDQLKTIFEFQEGTAEKEPSWKWWSEKGPEKSAAEDHHSKSSDRQVEQSPGYSSKSGESCQRREQETREDANSSAEKSSSADAKKDSSKVSRSLDSFLVSFRRKAGGAPKKAQNQQNNQRIQRQPNKNKIQKRGNQQGQGNRRQQNSGGVSIKIKNRGPSG